jgi:hypothetical protein
VQKNGSCVKKSVSPKKALAESIQRLGPEATHNSLVEFAKSEFGITFQFLLIVPRRRVNRRVRIGNKSRFNAS